MPVTTTSDSGVSPILVAMGLTSETTTVTEKDALKLSTVYSCVRVLAEGLAVLPWGVRRATSNGSELYRRHPNYHLLHNEPNPHMTSFSFREVMMVHLLLWGNFYAWIERDALNRPVAFWPLFPSEVSVVEYKKNLYYQTKYGVMGASEVIHVAGLGFDGITGKSPIRLQAEQLGISLNAQTFGGSFFKEGATLGGILSTETTLKPEQRKQIKDEWYANAHGPKNNHSTKVLEGGFKYQRIGVPPEEAQYLQTRQLGATEICGMYRVPPHMVAILDRSTNNNIEYQGIDFVKYSLMPWIERVQQEFNRKIFRESEKGQVFNSLNVNGLLKGDIAAQTAHVREMMDRGVYSINDALSFFGQNTIGDDGARRFTMLNMVPLDRIDDKINAEVNKNKANGQEGK